MKKRRYNMKARARQQLETRERIVDAAVALHEELGPAATTISALAERAGVQRLTVYRHFSGEDEIFRACSAKWFGQHPPPDIRELQQADPVGRPFVILRALYRYYRDTRGMWRSLYHDRDRMESLEAPMQGFEEYLQGVADAILESLAARRTRRLKATVGHAVRFSTWASLDEQGLRPKAMATLVSGWIEAAAGQPSR